MQFKDQFSSVICPSKYSKASMTVITLVVLMSSFLLYSQDSGFKYLRNFTQKEYDHAPQSWDMVQADNGMLYVANDGGVLEYDGVSWRVIYIGEKKSARSIAISENGTIYVGGKDEIGYLKPDENGSLQYQSLVQLLKEKDRGFSNVWSTHATKDGVYFRTSYSLIRVRKHDKSQIKVLKVNAPQLFRGFFKCNGEIWVLIKGVGFHRLVKDEWQLMPEFETLKDERVKMIEPYSSPDRKDTKLFLIGAAKKGFFLFDGKQLTEFPLKNHPDLVINELANGIRLYTGDYALATHKGMFIMDSNGNITFQIDRNYNLQNENVRNVFQDKSGNIWLSLENGISRFEYSSPFSILDERQGLPGLIYAVLQHGENLYVGSSRGLYVRRSNAEFKAVPEIYRDCNSLVSFEDSVLAASTDGVFIGKANSWRKIHNGKSYKLLVSQFYPGLVWCGKGGGLVSLDRRNGQWMEKSILETNSQEVRGIIENTDGSLWILAASTVYHLRIQPGNLPPIVESYNEDEKLLPAGELYLSKVDQRLVVATEGGLFWFQSKTNTFVPFTSFNDQLSEKAVFRIIQDKSKNIWLYSVGSAYRFIPGSNGVFEKISAPFKRIPPTSQVNVFYPQPRKDMVWFGTNEGVIGYKYPEKKEYNLPFFSLIRKVKIDNKLYFDGCDGCSVKSPVIQFKNRKNLYIEFAAPFFEREDKTMFSVFLEGFDDDWSGWSTNHSKNYSLLDSGSYKIHVKARNIYERESREDVYEFRILTPWYRTWWAFLIYAAILIISVFYFIKWRLRYLEHEKEKLELTIKERTKEIAGKNKQLEEKTGQLREQSEKLKEMDEVKSRFFANISHEFRTPLTLIMSPLEHLLASDRDKKEKKTLNAMLRNSQRLLTLINQLLDLSQIDSGKVKMTVSRHNIVSFLKGCAAAFDLMTEKKGLDLEVTADQEEIFLYFNSSKMEEVMYNLLINAFKFTPPGGKITVSVSMAEEVAVLSVKDTGIGLSQEKMRRIFDRFYQAGDFHDIGHKGTGIGLALSREIIHLHHGTIDVNSKEGEGTEFVIKLPFGLEHFKNDEITEIVDEPFQPSKQKEINVLYSDNLDSDESPDLEDEHAVALDENEDDSAQPTILVVEDDADVRYYIREPLEEEGFKVLEAVNGSDGIAKAQTFMPDLIVSDVMMPEIEGTDLCRQLKQDIRTSHIPVILLTAKASEDNIVEGLETGADDYMTKPFNSRILLTRIKNLIELRKQLQTKFQRQRLMMPSEIQVSSLDEQFIKQFLETVDKNFQDPEFNIDVICKIMDMGRSTLFKKVKALTGEGPNQFILSYRLERGAQLLRVNYGNVTKVAMAVGFGSAAYFSKCFKEKFDRSPRDFQAAESEPTRA